MIKYPPSTGTLEAEIRQELARPVPSPLAHLAERLLAGAKAFDVRKAAAIGLHPTYLNVTRAPAQPAELTLAKVRGADWADNEDRPLERGESWNAGRRTTNTGIAYRLDEKGRPLNPYMNTGLNGRGCLGLFGPNHAVDNGVLVLKPDENGVMTAYALGITRRHEGNLPAFAGGFAKFIRNREDGSFQFDESLFVDSRTEEFFEEMVSGSIELLPEYESQLETIFLRTGAQRRAAQGASFLSAAEDEELRTEIETALKLQQVKERDPGFLQRLRAVIAAAKDCYAGPVLADPRNTNNAWIETRLSWFTMSDAVWQQIRGDAPVFDYQLMAGDDAGSIVYHRLDKNLIETAYASHGAMFTFMAASYLADASKRGENVDADVLSQFRNLAGWLESREAQLQIQASLRQTLPGQKP